MQPIDFLLQLFEGISGAIELTALRPKDNPDLDFGTWTDFIPEATRAEELRESLAALSLINHRGYGVSYGLATRSEVLPTGRGKKRGGEANALYVPGFWADCDMQPLIDHATGEIKRDARTLDELIALLSDMPTPPSIVSNTGGGVHALWLLTEPLWMVGYGTSRTKNAVHRGLQRYVGSDPVANGDRLFRLPGTYNTKRQPWQQVEFVWCDWSLHYPLSAFEMYAIEQPVAVPRVIDDRLRDTIPDWIQEFIDSPPATGERNNTLYRMAATLKDFGWSEASVQSLLVGFAGLPQHSVTKTIHSAYQKPARGRVALNRDDTRLAYRQVKGRSNE